MSESQIKFQWQVNIKVLIFAAVFLPITLAASVWQLNRAEEKREMLAEQSTRMNLPAASLQQLDLNGPQNYRPVRVSGHWAESYFFLENRVRNGRPGYEVIGVFESGDLNVLVNRGWIEASFDRQVLPEVAFDTAQAEIHGYLYRSAKQPFTLGEPVWTGAWPERIQALEWDKLTERLDRSVFPYLVRLNPDSESAFTTGWEIVNLPPQKHMGYAVQWLALAMALVILTLFASSNLGAWIKHRMNKSA